MAIGGGIAAAAVAYSAFRRRSEDDISGEVVLITGGSRGLGLQMAREFAAEGCRIVICARDRFELARAQDDLEARGAEVLAVVCDVSDREQVSSLFQAAFSRFGRVDILVNNAGVIQVGPIQHMRVEDFERAMGVIFWGTVYPTLEVMPQMLERGRGRIVNITSIGGKVSVPHLIPYNCAKFATVALSEGLRAELSPAGIKVITIVPGLMRTGSYQQASFKGQAENELTWFGLGASLPGVSINAGRAARQIVSATKRGDAEKVLSTAATVLAQFHGMFPGLTANLMSFAQRAILPEPSPRAGNEEHQGKEIQEKLSSWIFDFLTSLSRSAGQDLNQRPV
jgi:NAD(P)-dependent dehydrogenase (short-subunit alcohol dehydrogenase family)